MKFLIVWMALSLVSMSGFAGQAVSPTDAADMVTKGRAELIDVREREEIETTGMATPAHWLAKSAVDAASDVYRAFVKGLDRNKILIFYCRTGRRAEVVATHFESLGFRTLNMGGFEDWQKAGLPIKDLKQKKAHSD